MMIETEVVRELLNVLDGEILLWAIRALCNLGTRILLHWLEHGVASSFRGKYDCIQSL